MYKLAESVLTRKELERTGSMFSLHEFLKKCFVPGQDLPEFVPELPVVPVAVRKDLLACEEYALPAATGTTTGVAFYPTEAAAAQLKTKSLVVLTHALGYHPCEPMWVWIHSFLKQGFHVLVVALDGHAKFNQSLFDVRSASRSLPLILKRMQDVLFASTSRSVQGYQTDLNVFLFGHFMGATYSLLAAAREPAGSCVKAVICNAPTVTVSGNFEFESQSPPMRHPIRYLKDGTKMSAYYGLSGFKRIWSGSDNRSLRNKLATACGLESQVRLFLSESLADTNAFAGIKIPVFWIYGERDKGKGAATFEQLINQSAAKLFRFSDPVRSSRGIQYSQVWPQKIANLVAEFSNSGETPSLDGQMLGHLLHNNFSGDNHAV